jgi:hypothetical protein
MFFLTHVLIHVANVIYLASYLVKDILWLRLLAVVAGSVLLAVYALLPHPLWGAFAWNVVFLLVNLKQIRMLLLERRAVPAQPSLDAGIARQQHRGTGRGCEVVGTSHTFDGGASRVLDHDRDRLARSRIVIKRGSARSVPRLEEDEFVWAAGPRACS